MKLNNKIHISLENFDKCYLTCDMDCPLGQLYDYSCALMHFAMAKMKESEPNRDKSPELVKE